MPPRLLPVAAVALACLVQAPGASAAVSCHYDPTQHAMTVTLTSPGDFLPLSVDAADHRILVGGDACPGAIVGSIARTDNVDRIEVTDTSGGDTVVSIEHAETFAPGWTDEGPLSVSEIEIDLSLGAGTDLIGLQGTDGADRYAAGANGVNTSGATLDLDADIHVTGHERLFMRGEDGADHFSGQGGRGTGGPVTAPLYLEGDAGGDRLAGGDGDDVVWGFLGDDDLEGGGGADQLHGGLGADAVRYDHAPAGVTVTLDPDEPLQQTGAAGADDIIAVELLHGSPHDDHLAARIDGATVHGGSGDDRLTGSMHAESLDGGDGADVIDAGAELALPDTFTGGQGIDTISYAAAPHGMLIDLDNGVAVRSEGAGGADALASLEGATGTKFADLIAGSDLPNRLDGGLGPDLIEARSGSDAIAVRDDEPDSVDCGADADTVTADRQGVDALTGCEAADFVTDPPPSQPEPAPAPAPQPQPQPQPPAEPDTQPLPPAPDTLLAFALRARRVQPLLARRALVITAACAGEPCTIRLAGRLGRLALEPVTRALAGGATQRIALPLSRRVLARLRTRRDARVALTVRASDAAGNVVVRTRWIRLER